MCFTTTDEQEQNSQLISHSTSSDELVAAQSRFNVTFLKMNLIDSHLTHVGARGPSLKLEHFDIHISIYLYLYIYICTMARLINVVTSIYQNW